MIKLPITIDCKLVKNVLDIYNVLFIYLKCTHIVKCVFSMYIISP